MLETLGIAVGFCMMSASHHFYSSKQTMGEHVDLWGQDSVVSEWMWSQAALFKS